MRALLLYQNNRSYIFELRLQNDLWINERLKSLQNYLRTISKTYLTKQISNSEKSMIQLKSSWKPRLKIAHQWLEDHRRVIHKVQNQALFFK